MAEQTLQQTLGLAAEQYRQRQFAEAQELCRQILVEQPENVDAICLLGMIARQIGDNATAAHLLSQAIAIAPVSAGIHFNLANALRDLGKVDDAIAAYRQAVQLQPDLAPAYSNLGSCLKDKGLTDQAIDAYNKAIALRPGSAQTHSNLGAVLSETGRFDEAIRSLENALALDAKIPAAHYNLGNALASTGKQSEAAAAYRQAITLRPTYSKAYVDLGRVLLHMNQLHDAATAAHQAIAIDPTSPDAHCLLGSILAELNQPDAAIAAFREAIALNPGLSEAHGNLGAMLKGRGQLDDAVNACRQAISLNTNLAEAHANLAAALKDIGQIDEAVTAARQAVLLNPSDAAFHSCLAGTLHYHPDYDAHAIARECCRWNDQHASPLAKFIQPHLNDKDPDRRLRIGYVSPDFHNHVVASNLLPWFGLHDHSRFEIFCYAQVRCKDEVTAEFQTLSDSWRDIVGKSEQQVADQIRRDQIDILVDLALHTGDNRLLVFARKPAPVQVTFAGYPGSTGVKVIGYRLSDPYLDPPGMDESVYSETTIRLADSFWCYNPREYRNVQVNSLPCLSSGIFTFGCLNNFCKINPPLLDIWAVVLRKVPDSRLLLLAPDGIHREKTRDYLSHRGVDPVRIIFTAHKPREQYLQLYNQIDLGLDTFPYNGHTTSLDSLWMGVPVVTLVGDTVVSRAGWSQLSNLGLTEFASHDAGQFIDIAVKQAQDRDKLSNLRASLRNRMEKSPLMDAKKFAQSIESAYRLMWHRWL